MHDSFLMHYAYGGELEEGWKVGNDFSMGESTQGTPSQTTESDQEIPFNEESEDGQDQGKGTPDFGTGVLADDAVSVNDTGLTVKTVDARKVFDVGDVLVDNGNAAIGTIKSITSATNIILESGAAEAVAADDEIVNKNPVTFILHFEK